MPIKLIPPRAGMSKNWRIRGAYLGERVDQTTGTADRKLAAKILSKVREQIERGAFSRPGAPTFASAALNYCQAGGERRFVMRLHDHFGETPLTRIDQAAVDAAALALYPRATPATRNRQVYSPVSAILKAAGVADGLKRPKGARGARRLTCLAHARTSAKIVRSRHRAALSRWEKDKEKQGAENRNAMRTQMRTQCYARPSRCLGMASRARGRSPRILWAPTAGKIGLRHATHAASTSWVLVARFCVWERARYDLRHVRTLHTESLMGGNPSIGRFDRTAAQSRAALQHRADNSDRGDSRLGRRQ